MFYLLDSGTNRAKDNSKIESYGLTPSVFNLITNGREISLRQVRHGLEIVGVSSYQRPLLEFRKDVGKLILVGKLFDIPEEATLAEIGQRILDPARVFF